MNLFAVITGLPSCGVVNLEGKNINGYLEKFYLYRRIQTIEYQGCVHKIRSDYCLL